MIPSPTESNGRDDRGRFAEGNHAGKGNPLAKRVQDIRAALLSAVTGDDVRQIVAALVERAKAGDVLAAREVLDRCIGRPHQSIDAHVSASVTPDTVRDEIKLGMGWALERVNAGVMAGTRNGGAK